MTRVEEYLQEHPAYILDHYFAQNVGGYYEYIQYQYPWLREQGRVSQNLRSLRLRGEQPEV